MKRTRKVSQNKSFYSKRTTTQCWSSLRCLQNLSSFISCWTANFADGFAHGFWKRVFASATALSNDSLACFRALFICSFPAGVCSNALTASSNLMPLRFGIITSCFFFFFFGTDSLSAPGDTRDFWFNKAGHLLVKFVPSYH